jgi:hypothetical protein
MIEICKAFKVGENTFPTIEAAQEAAIRDLGFAPDVACAIIKAGAQIADILTTIPTSKPKARKVNGGTKTRRAKAPTDATMTSPANTLAA